METVWTLFERSASEFATRPAAVETSRRVSYAELDLHVRSLASRLQETGLRGGDRVAILDANSIGFLCATFAAAAVGAVLVPLNTRLAASELAEILRDAEARVLLASERFRGLIQRLASDGTPLRATLFLDEPRRPARGGGFRPLAQEPEDLAHLYYTSGTTGRSKGVMLTHRNVCVHAETAVSELGIGPADRWGHFAPMFHLADAWATFAITRVGGLHVLLPRFDARSALELIEKERITVTNLVPTMLVRMVEDPLARSLDLSSMRLLLSGGAPIAPELVRKAMETFRCEYAQTYGMTETSPYLTLSLLHAHLRDLPFEEALRFRVRTGRPFGAVELEVVDPDGRRVPADDRSVGEIRVRGPTVSPGYWKRPEETAAAFRDGWLYTGDLAVVDEEGYVNIVDRRKDMIITGGENVYSTEVEHALSSHPAVLEAAVVGVPDPEWGEAVRAVVVLKEGASASAEELVAHCRTLIAGYKVPRAVEFRDELPKTGTGKIAKQSLRAEARALGACESERPI